jgi:hypothetical protein
MLFDVVNVEESRRFWMAGSGIRGRLSWIVRTLAQRRRELHVARERLQEMINT